MWITILTWLEAGVCIVLPSFVNIIAQVVPASACASAVNYTIQGVSSNKPMHIRDVIESLWMLINNHEFISDTLWYNVTYLTSKSMCYSKSKEMFHYYRFRISKCFHSLVNKFVRKKIWRKGICGQVSPISCNHCSTESTQRHNSYREKEIGLDRQMGRKMFRPFLR